MCACCLLVRSWRVPKKRFLDMSVACGAFSPQSLDFQRKIIAGSGLGEAETFLPPGAFHLCTNNFVVQSPVALAMFIFFFVLAAGLISTCPTTVVCILFPPRARAHTRTHMRTHACALMTWAHIASVQRPQRRPTIQ